MKPYSEDLRLKVLDAVDRGMDRKEVARVFGVSLPSIKRWLKRRRETGGVEASTIPGPPAVKGDMLAEWLPSQLERNPELTLQEHCEAFEEDQGVKVSRATMCRRIALVPGGWPLKILRAQVCLHRGPHRRGRLERRSRSRDGRLCLREFV
jgi:transposase